MPWSTVTFTVTKLRGSVPSTGWAAVDVDLDNGTCAEAVAPAWPYDVDLLVGERFQARATRRSDDTLQLACVQPYGRRDLSCFAYQPARKRPAPTSGVTRWSQKGGGGGHMAVLSDDVITTVLDLHSSADDRLLAPLRRIDTRLLGLVDAAVQRVLGLSDDQMEVFAAVLQKRRSAFVTGPGGTGKSHLMRVLCARLPGVVVTASTGAAAEKLGLGASTIHSALGLGIGTAEVSKLIAMHKPGKTKASKTIRKLECLVVDEVSMLTAEFIDKTTALLNGLGRRNVQYVFCGDPLQLGAVKERSEGIFFKSKLFVDRVVEPYVLTKSHRQEDTEFSKILNRARVGRAWPEDVEWLKAHSAPTEDAIRPRLVCVNRDADSYNESRMAALPGLATTYTATDRGDEAWRRKLTGPLSVTLKVGSRVMLVKNLPELGPQFHNGAVGTVTHFHGASAGVCFDFGEEARIAPATFEARDEKTEEIKATRTVVPLVVAFAISIHKAQGATLDSVHVDVSRCFAPGQAYTGLSRIRDVSSMFIVGLTTSKLNNVNREALAWYKSIK